MKNCCCSFIPLCSLCHLPHFERTALFLSLFSPINVLYMCANALVSLNKSHEQIAQIRDGGSLLHCCCVTMSYHVSHLSQVSLCTAVPDSLSLSLPLSHTSTCLHVCINGLSACHGHQNLILTDPTTLLTLHGSRYRKHIPYGAWR